MIWLNSAKSSFSNSVNRKAFKQDMEAEFKFFDKKYFENHSEARINFYYSGHGLIDKIHLADFELNYDEAVKNIIDSAN